MVTVQKRSGYTIPLKKKVNTNKESKSQPSKGHCQAETSALQYTPHLTLTQLEKEGDEGKMGKKEGKIPGGGFPGIVELLKEQGL